MSLRNVKPGDILEPPRLDRDIWSEGGFTTTQCAEFLDTSRKTVFEMMRDGRLPWGLLGARRRIPRRAVIDLLAGSAEG